MEHYGYATFWDLEEVDGLTVVDFSPARGLGDPEVECPRLAASYLVDQNPTPLSDTRRVAMLAVIVITGIVVALWSAWALAVGLFALVALLPYPQPRLVAADVDGMWEAFGNDPRISEVRALVIGPWFREFEEGPEATIERLAALSSRMPSLRAIFFGDITSEECEVSWIQQGSMTRLLDAFPGLESLTVRGGNGLRFEGLRHGGLRKLVVQSGGLSRETVADLADAKLESLEHLELWLGIPDYGGDAEVDDLRPLWQPRTFPRLDVLGLRDAERADEIAEALATDVGAIGRLRVLDLSLGTLGDRGAAALYNSPELTALERLDLHHHYISPDWVERLRALPLDVELSFPQVADGESEDGEEIRYVAVAE